MKTADFKHNYDWPFASAWIRIYRWAKIKLSNARPEDMPVISYDRLVNTGPGILFCQAWYSVCFRWHSTWARIHESVISYDGHISRPGITELELGPSENSYSHAGKRSVIVVLEVSGFHTGCLVTKRCTAHGRRGLFVQLDNQVGSDIIT